MPFLLRIAGKKVVCYRYCFQFRFIICIYDWSRQMGSIEKDCKFLQSPVTTSLLGQTILTPCSPPFFLWDEKPSFKFIQTYQGKRVVCIGDGETKVSELNGNKQLRNLISS